MYLSLCLLLWHAGLSWICGRSTQHGQCVDGDCRVQLSRRSRRRSWRHQIQGRYVHISGAYHIWLSTSIKPDSIQPCCITCQETTRVTYAGSSWVAIWRSTHRTSTFSNWPRRSTMPTGSWAYSRLNVFTCCCACALFDVGNQTADWMFTFLPSFA